MPSIIDDLQNPALLPDKTEKVSVVQTHISIVFVADEFVYKVKKPVNFGFLDFTTLEKRKYYCNQEVRLNRRLSRDIYLDVLPVRFDGERHILGGTLGEVVEYAVKMRRIPDKKLMKSVFDSGELTRDHLNMIAQVLASFHMDALQTSEIDQYGQPEAFRINTDENFEQVEKYIGATIQEKEFKALKRWTDDFYRANGDLFFKRIGQGRIRDCHGDLHMEHICFTEPLSIIDCIEFNDRFRYSDTVADIAFLLMDLEYHGGKDDAAILWNLYKELAGEKDVDSLLTFYKVYRAFVRGKVDSFQEDDDNISANKKDEAAQRATKYFQLAYSYIL
ncbi:MAG: gluconokinase [Deltaproteobacteria bacterium]|nr:gluconokinase [Deltaproteobacteria bacterium]MBW2113374.1 gluconokinase [Deltaproteobacteria bacterium]